jgi:ornithine decarboxylase
MSVRDIAQTKHGSDYQAAGASIVGERFDRFLADCGASTPFIAIDLDVVQASYVALREMLPHARIFYAVKANPSPQVISSLSAVGANFDLASEGEIKRCLQLGIAADRLSFGNTVKRDTEIAKAHASGIDLFAFDSIGELEKLARAAPGARVFCRMLVHNPGAQWPLTRKFGCNQEMAIELLQRARTLGLKPIGISFHVGSQQTDPRQWSVAISAAARIFHSCARQGLDLNTLNVGGGLPAQYLTALPSLASYIETIDGALRREFGKAMPQIIIEPGRYLVGDAGILRSQVLLVARKSRQAKERWVYLDVGRYNGLAEVPGERIQYRIRTARDGQQCGPVILAGPTCDSTDIIYEHTGYKLPIELTTGDFVDFLSAGAYTASYASVEFNGFPPIQTYCF